MELIRMKLRSCLLFAILLPLASAVPAAAGPGAGHGHGHAHFSAGQPGDPKKKARIVYVRMQEAGKRMTFNPARIEVRKGEQIRFVLENEGIYDHEFVLATRGENRKHAELMKKHPDMEHDDPNARRLSPYLRGEILWRFTTAGEFEFACLIPGHLEAGMVGKIIVK
jgi:uncharacterized cupredoxin-like copper-binding protein